MNLGKSLRLRRMFSSGRALVIDSETIALDPLAQVRQLGRSGADAVVVTPGMVQHVCEDVDELALVLRIDAGPNRPHLLTVQGALELGADAVLTSLSAASAVAVENFARASEDARRLGMPLVAHVLDEEWRDGAMLAADFGADVVVTALPRHRNGLRNFVRVTGVRVLVRVGQGDGEGFSLLDQIYDALQDAAQGLVLARRDLVQPEVFEVIHGLAHQGITAPQAAAMLDKVVSRTGNAAGPQRV